MQSREQCGRSRLATTSRMWPKSQPQNLFDCAQCCELEIRSRLANHTWDTRWADGWTKGEHLGYFYDVNWFFTKRISSALHQGGSRWNGCTDTHGVRWLRLVLVTIRTECPHPLPDCDWCEPISRTVVLCRHDSHYCLSKTRLGDSSNEVRRQRRKCLDTSLWQTSCCNLRNPILQNPCG